MQSPTPHQFGLVGFASLAIEYKHGLHQLYAPFHDCHSFWDCFGVVAAMNDTETANLIMWGGILIAGLTLIVRWASGPTARLISGTKKLLRMIKAPFLKASPPKTRNPAPKADASFPSSAKKEG